MKFIIILAVIAFVAADGNRFTKFENLDVAPFIMNDRYLNSLTLCLVSEGPCTREGSDIKEVMHEGIQSNCADCSTELKKKVAQVIKQIQTKLPDKWEILLKQNDPEGKYKDTIQKFLVENSD